MLESNPFSTTDNFQIRRLAPPPLSIQSFHRNLASLSGNHEDSNKASISKPSKAFATLTDFGNLIHHKEPVIRDVLPRLEINCRSIDFSDDHDTPRKTRPRIKKAALKDIGAPEQPKHQPLEECLQSRELEPNPIKARISQRLQSPIAFDERKTKSSHQRKPQHSVDFSNKPIIANSIIPIDHSLDGSIPQKLDNTLDPLSLYTIKGSFFLEDEDNGQIRDKGETPPASRSSKSRNSKTIRKSLEPANLEGHNKSIRKANFRYAGMANKSANNETTVLEDPDRAPKRESIRNSAIGGCFKTLDALSENCRTKIHPSRLQDRILKELDSDHHRNNNNLSLQLEDSNKRRTDLGMKEGEPSFPSGLPVSRIFQPAASVTGGNKRFFRKNCNENSFLSEQKQMEPSAPKKIPQRLEQGWIQAYSSNNGSLLGGECCKELPESRTRLRSREMVDANHSQKHVENHQFFFSRKSFFPRPYLKKTKS